MQDTITTTYGMFSAIMIVLKITECTYNNELCVCMHLIFYCSDIAAMGKDSVATFYGNVQFQLKSVPALNYHVQHPMSPV